MGIESIRAFLGKPENQIPQRHDFKEVMKAYELLAQLMAYQRDMEKTAEAFQEEYQIASVHGLKSAQAALEEKLGIAEMRQGEMENCVAAHNTMSYILPLCSEA